MKKEKRIIDLKLSELVDQSLAKGVVPVLRFVSRDEADLLFGKLKTKKRKTK